MPNWDRQMRPMFYDGQIKCSEEFEFTCKDYKGVNPAKQVQYVVPVLI